MISEVEGPIENKVQDVCDVCKKGERTFPIQTPMGNKVWKREVVCGECFDKQTNKPNRAQRRKLGR